MLRPVVISIYEMSRSDFDRVCRFPVKLPRFGKREVGAYAAGCLYAIGWWVFLDAQIQSAHSPEAPVHVSFEDWVTGLLATLGMIIISCINKRTLMGEESGGWSGGYGNDSVAWRAKLFLFIGFALLAGGLAGGIAVYVVKYYMGCGEDLCPSQVDNWGWANIIMNACIMISATLLWLVQNTENEYEYNLTL